ncbi:fatty-acid-binding protein 3, chloroplastic isoform X2 [Quercus robur]|uniref:fatty-acid-binding protein 3, chloroplastic isoform X2 n=1 Tax=Quercus robur TaxID=38942 RepID=UPI002163AE2B|nr:fatty-acid-binding protein 3, chloroplastic isoform X2 [Quercus robur]
MVGASAIPIPTPLSLSTPIPRISSLRRISNPTLSLCQTHYFSLLVTFPLHFSPHKHRRTQTHFSPNASSSSSGYREKSFAIIGVKVYAAGLYVNPSILSELNAWKGQSTTKIQEIPSLFNSIFQSPLEKSLKIVLVRDVDGKTFWDAFDDAISPRIKAPTSIDESALSTFRCIFQGRPLKKGTFIFLTWLEPSKMLVCVSLDGLPSNVEATIESGSVTLALFDVFFGNGPVSPSLKDSVAKGLATILK